MGDVVSTGHRAPLDYDAACKAAADRQGLTAIGDALAAVGVEMEVEQTGGFTMVGVVRRDDDMLLTLTDDSWDGSLLLAGETTVSDRYEEGEPEIRLWTLPDHAALADLVQRWLAREEV